MFNIEFFLNGLLAVIWLVFWVYNFQHILKMDILAPKICKLVFLGFAIRFIGNIGHFGAFNYIGAFIIFYAIYVYINNKRKTNDAPTS